MKQLTKPEEKLLLFLKDQRNWRAPSYESMRKWLNYDSDGYVGVIIKSLKAKGIIGADNLPLPHSESNAT